MSHASSSRPLPPPRASSGEKEFTLVSPLMTLMPTGYRTIQPLQKGKGWHTNGKISHHRSSTQASDSQEIDQHSEKDRGVVFPLLQGYVPGPDARTVEGAIDDRQEDEVATCTCTGISPKAPSTPSTNGMPRRPSRTKVQVNTGSFRSRVLSGSPSNSRPISPATGTNDETRKVNAVVGPDPVLMQQLWQEYATRSHAANRHVDTATYHEKMNRRYGEQRALKERIVQLEKALKTMEKERDEAQVQTENTIKQQELVVQNPSTTKVLESTLSGVPENAEEQLYIERSFALEGALAQANVSVLTLQEQLQKQTENMTQRTQSFEAQLLLERSTNLELARQLREVSAGFAQTSAELVETRVNLQREQQQAQEFAEQVVQNAQVLTDSRRAQLETRMKVAVRSLGRETLKTKMEILVHRTMRAEQSLRVAQLETERVSRERDDTRDQLEQILSSHALKYHSLGATGGIPGLLERSTQLSNSAKIVSDQLLLLQVLYEETEDPDEAFCIHFVAYEPRSAQDDFLTFYLRDIERLVPNHDSFLARHSVRRRERLQALSELLIVHIHAGYKNGHLVLTETSGPEAAMQFSREQKLAHQEQQLTRKVTVYRGTRYLPLVNGDYDLILAELIVSEAFAAATSQIWWLEICTVVLGCEGVCGSELLTAKVDLRRLLSFCSMFASYRPSENLVGGNTDENELFGVHEALLEPLFNCLRVVISSEGAAELEIAGEVENQLFAPIEPRKLSVENLIENEMGTQKTAIPSTLTHQCVVNVNDVFYCVRLQELWDGELLLDITMDDPDTQQHFHRVLFESQIAELADRLVNEGAINYSEDDTSHEEQEAAARQVKYGLSSVLYHPLCELVQCYIQPILPHPSQVSNNTVTEAGMISLGTLFDDEEASKVQLETKSYETRSIVFNLASCKAFGWSQEREIRVISTSSSVQPDERSVYQILEEMLVLSRRNSAEIAPANIRRQRVGVRFHDNSGFSLVQTISGNLANFGHVAIFTILPLTSGLNYLPLVLVIEDFTNEDSPLKQVVDALGIDGNNVEFTRNALATGSRREREAANVAS